MSDVDTEFDDEPGQSNPAREDFAEAKVKLEARCKTANIPIESIEPFNGSPRLKMEMNCARWKRPIVVATHNISGLLSIPFEKYVFLSGLEAICSYADGTVEAGIKPAVQNFLPSTYTYRRIFGGDWKPGSEGTKAITVPPDRPGMPHIEISLATNAYLELCRVHNRFKPTLKLSGCHLSNHDDALSLLNKVAGAVLFQLDLLTDTPLVLERERKRIRSRQRAIPRTTDQVELQYPKTQFDSAPMSLYWYARSADSMPLLQFLAFYQVVEFYFPIYSRSEAQRKLKGILKDPTFRSDRDADIARLLAAIYVSRSGAYGDERSQLRATLNECIDPDALRRYFEEDEITKNFFLTKSKSLPYHKIPLANKSADLRNDVADRIYDIRCKIVHTKADSRDENIDLLLPFTHESEQLSDDIELIQFLAQAVLVSSSTPFNAHA
ncbi:hypothetical protein VSR82_25195 [Burkholderia sp. JPY481]